MTLRAFVLGLAAVVALCLLDPYTSFIKSYGWQTEGAFPEGAVFLLVFFTIVFNFVVKVVRRRWALRQAELMLIWCMLIVGATVASEGLMSYFFPQLAGPAYIARRADIAWKDTALELAPKGLLLSNDPRSVAVQHYYEGRPEGGRFPWSQWAGTMSHWLVFMACFYLATFFLCGILRKQWVERERLQFPLARVPLEFTEEGEGLLPRIFSNRAFLLGVAVTAAFRLLRALPLFFGAENAWSMNVPLENILRETPLAQLYLLNFGLWLLPIGFAYLVPADVSLSIWFFYLLGRVELQSAAWMGSTMHYGGRNSQLLVFQQVASYLTFTVGALYMARRHLWAVIRKAVSRGRGIDDSTEPLSYRVGFWGLTLCSLGTVGWFAYHGMKVWVASLLFGLLMVMQLVHARIAAQGGMFVPRSQFRAPDVLHSMGFGVFGPVGAVVAQVQWGGMMQNTVSLLGPPAIHAFRISDVFERYRRLLLPVLFVALMVGLAASSYMTLSQAYGDGALNFSYTWGSIGNPKMHFDMAHARIERPTDVPPGLWKPFVIGVVATAFVMFMRARFYWWPVHPIGILTIASHHTDRMWLSFLLGWLIKVLLLKFGTGRIVRQGRYFFIGFIMTEASVLGISSLARTFSGGVIPDF